MESGQKIRSSNWLCNRWRKDKNDNERGNFDSIEKLLTYATNPDKTEKLFYTTGINCKVDNAVKEMKFVKRLYGKEKRNTCISWLSIF